VWSGLWWQTKTLDPISYEPWAPIKMEDKHTSYHCKLPPLQVLYDWLSHGVSNRKISSNVVVVKNNFGPSVVRALPLAAGINEGGHYFGPSRVRALPLAAGINKGGHYFRYIFLFFFLPPLFKTTEGVVVGFQIFAWGHK
jgi:hypothetical protein